MDCAALESAADFQATLPTVRVLTPGFARQADRIVLGSLLEIEPLVVHPGLDIMQALLHEVGEFSFREYGVVGADHLVGTARARSYARRTLSG